MGAASWPGCCVDQAVRRVVMDLDAGTLRLVLDRGTVTCLGVHSSNLLGPWDGSPGRVADLRLERVDGLCFLEWRVQYPEVPRHYRVVCREAEWSEDRAAPPPVSP